jgi:prepilin-type processing-associated H-X9-DG protein
VDLVIVLLIIALVLALMFIGCHGMQAVGGATVDGPVGPRERARRASCLAQLKGISMAGLIYCAENRGVFPTSPNEDNPYGTVVGWNRFLDDEKAGGGTVCMSNTRCWFKLLQGGERAYIGNPESLICPSSKNLGHTPTNAEPRNTQGVAYMVYDFDGSAPSRVMNDTESREFSYSFQMVLRHKEGNTQLGQKFTNTHDPRKAVAADRNPYSNSLVNSPGKAGQPDASRYDYDPAAPSAMPNPPDSAEWATMMVAGQDPDNKRFNSRNHEQKGQNVAFLDGHAKWYETSLAGADEDCIWALSVDKGTVKADELTHAMPAAGERYGMMKSKPVWVTDSLLIP